MIVSSYSKINLSLLVNSKQKQKKQERQVKQQKEIQKQQKVKELINCFKKLLNEELENKE